MKKIMKKILETKLILEEVKRILVTAMCFSWARGFSACFRSFCARSWLSESPFMGIQAFWIWITCSDNAAKTLRIRCIHATPLTRTLIRRNYEKNNCQMFGL